MPKAKPKVRRSARLQELDQGTSNQTKKSAIQKTTNSNPNRTPSGRLIRGSKGPDTPEDEDQDSNQGESESVSEQEEDAQEKVDSDDPDNQEEHAEEEQEDAAEEKVKSNYEKDESDTKAQSHDENQSGEHSIAEDEQSGSAKSEHNESSSSHEQSDDEEQEEDEESDVTKAGKYKLRKRKHGSQSSPSKSLQRLLRKKPKRMRTTMLRSPKKERHSLRYHDRYSERRGNDQSGEEQLISESDADSSSKEESSDNQHESEEGASDTSRDSKVNDPYLDKALRRPGLRLTRQRVMEIEKQKKNPTPQSRRTPTSAKKKTSQRSPVKKARRSTRQKKSIARFDPLTYRRRSSVSMKRTSVNSSSRNSRSSRRRRETSSSDSSDSSSSDSSSSGDDRDHKKQKYSLPLPINMPFGQQISKGKNSMLKADIDPMTVDSSISWDSVGGLDSHIRSLKEMVMFPLLYPEIFDKFAIAPPKGVLFYGPPGTGKTLVARALANTCSQTGQKVAFFMRKGADCLSKWVGEAERQLRLLFQQAYLMQPSIIFFDEIDGLAPVRSSKQDQIHSSIVSTLLALMDGLDSRGQIIVIGATNRIDAIDPALRRPGRFDREFLFTLPSRASRRKILSINCNKWDPKPSDQMLDDLAEAAVGYCGADLKALCTEASLQSLRRHYPQIYSSNEKLLIDVNSIQICREDFLRAMRSITPAAHRAAITYAKPLPREVSPLLERHLDQLKRLVLKIFPILQQSLMPNHALNAGHDNNTTVQSNNEITPNNNNNNNMPFSEYDDIEDFGVSSGSNFANQRMGDKTTAALYRPRLLIHGDAGMGQSYLSSSLLYILEQFPISCLDMSTLLSNSASRTLEEAFIADFRESLRKVPGIIFIPHIDSWWEAASFTLRSSFINNVLHDIECNTPVLLLATSDSPLADLPAELQNLFGDDNSYEIIHPDEVSRRNYFQSLVEDMKVVKTKNVIPFHEKYPPLPKAPVASAKALTEDELKAKKAEEEGCLRELRIFLRDCISKLYKERKYHLFFKPVNADQYPEYYEAVKNPLDLNMVLDKIDNYEYTNLQLFLDDVKTIVQNAIDHNPYGDNLRVESRAKAMQDIVFSRSKRLDPEVIAVCDRITEHRKNNPESEAEHSESGTRRRKRKGKAATDELQPQSAAEDVNNSKDGEPMQVDNTNNETMLFNEGIEGNLAPAKKVDSPKLTETPTRELKRVASSGKLRSPENVVVVIDSIPKSPGPSSKFTNGHAAASPSIQSQLLENGNLIFDENEAIRLQRVVIKNTAKASMENLMEVRAKVYQKIFAHQGSNDKRTLLSDVKMLLAELNMNDNHSPRKAT